MVDSDQALRSRQIQALYWASQDQPALEREKWLSDACGKDVALLDEVMTLASKLSPSSGKKPIFANEPPSAIAAALAAAGGNAQAQPGKVGVKPGDRLGTYQLVREIGRGGMGIVFEAREDPPLARTVAIKVVRAGMDSEEVVIRFELERRILADLDHPNIARVFSAGATAEGRPYFAMEWVDGPKITDYCDQKKLDVTDRLRLMVPVCQAVAYANSNGIIHRDIKPHNVLVAEDEQGRPVPKVIDFGIAKATELPPEARAILTATNVVMGTQIYWSPEQAGAIQGKIDNRTDVYLLGNLLYELLTGTPRIDPATLQENAMAQVLALLRDDPPRPRDRLTTLDYTRLMTVAQARGSDPRSLSQLMRGEPEWIVMQALRITPDRRYQSAGELARDLERYLAGQPVEAVPDLWYHQAWKTVRRHKLSIGVGATIFAGLLIAAVGLSFGLVRARAAYRIADQQRAIATAQRSTANEQRNAAEVGRTEAEHQRESTQAVLHFLTDDLLARASPARTSDENLRGAIVNSLIEPAAKTVTDRFGSQPLIRAAIQQRLSQVLRSLGRFDLALPQAQAALAIRQAAHREDDVDTFAATQEVAVDLMQLGRLDDAERLDRTLVARATQSDGDRFDVNGSLIELLDNYSVLQMAMQQYDAALATSQAAWDRGRRQVGDDDRLTLHALLDHIGVLQTLGRLSQADQLGRELLDHARHSLGADDPMTISAEWSLALNVLQEGRVGQAETLIRDAFTRCQHVLGADHPMTINTETLLAGILVDSGRSADAIPFSQDAWNRGRHVLGDDHLITLGAGLTLGRSLNKMNRPAEAAPVLRIAWPHATSALGPGDQRTIAAAVELARALVDLGSVADAEAPARAAHDAAHEVFKSDNPMALETDGILCDVLRRVSRAAEAEIIARNAFTAARTSYGQDSPITASVRENYALVLVALGRTADARSLVAGHAPATTTQPAETAAASTRAAATPTAATQPVQ